MNVPVCSIAEFLEARIEEDEERATSGWSRLGDTRWETNNYGQDHLTPAAVQAECAAKRGIIDMHLGDGCLEYCRTCTKEHGGVANPCPTIRHLATIYSDHPEYQQEWAI